MCCWGRGYRLGRTFLRDACPRLSLPWTRGRWISADRHRQVLLAACRADRHHDELIAGTESIGKLRRNLQISSGLARRSTESAHLNGQAADGDGEWQNGLGQ